MTGFTFGPVRVDVDTDGIASVYRGARTAIARRGLGVDSERVPEGWELGGERGDYSWPSSWTTPTGYWLTIWKVGGGGAHLTIKPRPKGWRVEYDPENSWMGGNRVAPTQPTFETAVLVALSAARRIDDGATARELYHGTYRGLTTDA